MKCVLRKNKKKMSNTKLGQEPAFPMSEYIARRESEGYSVDDDTKGMSKRLYLAGIFIQGLLSYHGRYWQSNSNNDPNENLGGITPDEAAILGLQYADSLLKLEKQ